MTIKELYEEAVERGAESYKIEIQIQDDNGYFKAGYVTCAEYNEFMQEVVLE